MEVKKRTKVVMLTMLLFNAYLHAQAQSSQAVVERTVLIAVLEESMSVPFPLGKFKKQMLETDYFNLANSELIKKQKLPKMQIVALGRVMEESDLLIEKVKAQPLPDAEKKKRIVDVKRWEKRCFTDILGVQLYAKYITYQSYAHERLCKAQYDFTEADYVAYKRITNNFAVAVKAINESKIVQAEKNQKKALVKEAKVVALRKALSPPAFDKWHQSNQGKPAELIKHT